MPRIKRKSTSDKSSLQKETTSKRDKSPKRRQCAHCQFEGCPSLKHRTKVPAKGANGYEIADKKSKKRLCCRCIQVLDGILYNECSSKEQCSACKTSTRPCCVCGPTDCKDLANFDVGYEGCADEEGYYCCLHRAQSRTFNDDRFAIYKCKPCEQRSTCDYLNADCELVDSSDSEYHCDSCQSDRYITRECDCCGGDCCLKCHQHDTRGRPETLFCQRCYEECDPENGDYWHHSKNATCPVRGDDCELVNEPAEIECLSCGSKGLMTITCHRCWKRECCLHCHGHNPEEVELPYCAQCMSEIETH